MSKSNISLTNHVDPSNADYVGAVNINTEPITNLGLGKSGDYNFSDASLYFKVDNKWISIWSAGGVINIKSLT